MIGTEGPVLCARGLKKSYGNVAALDGLDLDLRGGECVALIGHNGSGKTTALKLMAGYSEPTGGRVEVHGVDVHDDRDSHVARAGVAFVPDNPVFYDDLTVAEHLELVGLAHGVVDGLDPKIERLLKTLGLAERRDFLPGQLSRGLRQKAQLACAFVRPFSVLMLDEPIVGLDPRSQVMLHEMLLGVKTEGVGVLMSTHQLAFARGLADRAVILEGGRVVAEGPYEVVMESEEALRLGLS